MRKWVRGGVAGTFTGLSCLTEHWSCGKNVTIYNSYNKSSQMNLMQILYSRRLEIFFFLLKSSEKNSYWL